MAKVTLNDMTTGYQSATAYNANNDLIEAAIENTISRDGTSPNTMSGVLDMNTNTINNVGAPIHPASAARLQDIHVVQVGA